MIILLNCKNWGDSICTNVIIRLMNKELHSVHRRVPLQKISLVPNPQTIIDKFRALNVMMIFRLEYFLCESKLKNEMPVLVFTLALSCTLLVLGCLIFLLCFEIFILIISVFIRDTYVYLKFVYLPKFLSFCVRSFEPISLTHYRN